MGGPFGAGPLYTAVQVVYGKTSRQYPCRLDCEWCFLQLRSSQPAQLHTVTPEVLKLERRGEESP